jgi:hypothetical protein
VPAVKGDAISDVDAASHSRQWRTAYAACDGSSVNRRTQQRLSVSGSWKPGHQAGGAT